MKLEKRTLEILKNFNSINQSILFNQGNILKTISPSRTVFATATIKEEFPSQFAIYNIAKLLNVISKLSEPNIQIKEDHLFIGDKEQSVKYVFANPDQIVHPDPEKNITLDNPEISFDLSENSLSSLINMLGVLGLEEINICGDGKNLSIQAINAKNPTSDIFNIQLGKTKEKFRMVIKADNMLLLPANYHVEISSAGIASFKSEDVEYFIACEKNESKYGE